MEWRLLQVAFLPLLVAFKCSLDLDCELLGRCSPSGVCECSPGFTGPTCGQLDLMPVSRATHGKVWPISRASYLHNGTSIGWSFAPVYDPERRLYVAAIESVCNKWGAGVWTAAVSSATPDGPWKFEQRLGGVGTNSAHMKRLDNGTFVVTFAALASGIWWPANETADPTAPICVGDSVHSASAMEPVWPPCGPEESPSLGHNCICSRQSTRCTSVNGIYVATTEHFPGGPWHLSQARVSGAGWSPYNESLQTIGTSNPSAVVLQDGRALLGMRSHAGYWPSIAPYENETYGGGEHIGFAMSDSVQGPFTVVGNLSWQYGNDEDPFVWQQRDGTFHCLYHNGRGKWTNHGLHAFSTDGKTWHKPSVNLLPPCAARTSGKASPSAHNCSSMYLDRVDLDDGTFIELAGRERPALIFDAETGAPTWLYNGAINNDEDPDWYAMAQPIRGAS